jgi:L-amino acid N-acyltransferase YncA
MGKSVKLRDETVVEIRPMIEADASKSYAFFQRLQKEDRDYLRINVVDRHEVEKRLQNLDKSNVRRIAAWVEGDIVADAALELNSFGWKRHLAEYRIIVASDFKRRGLGMVMAGELYELAIKENVEEMVVELMSPQLEAKKIFERLGFKQEAAMKNMVVDSNGQKQDLILMRCNLSEIWNQIESYYEEFDNIGSMESA